MFVFLFIIPPVTTLITVRIPIVPAFMRIALWDNHVFFAINSFPAGNTLESVNIAVYHNLMRQVQDQLELLEILNNIYSLQIQFISLARQIFLILAVVLVIIFQTLHHLTQYHFHYYDS